MLKIKKQCAVFTIVKNEADFLPIWYNYYSKEFEENDIFILDHQSVDGSTKFYKNVKLVKNEFTQDNNWLLNITKSFQKELLNKYEYVLFANADEIVCPNKDKYKNIKHFLKENNKEIIRCNGNEVIHFPEEGELKTHDKILKQRKFWYENNELYSKPLLSRVPLNWTAGWHRLDGQQEPINEDLKLIHLHRMDYNMCRKRHAKVKNEKVFKADLEQKKWGWHHFVSEEDYPKWFYSINVAKTLHAPDALREFEKDKNKSLTKLQEEAKGFCTIIEPKWENVV